MSRTVVNYPKTQSWIRNHFLTPCPVLFLYWQPFLTWGTFLSLQVRLDLSENKHSSHSNSLPASERMICGGLEGNLVKQFDVRPSVISGSSELGDCQLPPDAGRDPARPVVAGINHPQSFTGSSKTHYQHNRVSVAILITQYLFRSLKFKGL